MTAALDALVESAKLSTSTGAGAHPQVKHVDQKNVPTHQMMSPCYAYIMFAMRVCVCVCVHYHNASVMAPGLHGCMCVFISTFDCIAEPVEFGCGSGSSALYAWRDL